MVQDEELRLVGWQYVRLLRRVITRFDCLSRQLVQPFGLTNMQALSLMFVERRPGTSQAGLVTALESDAAAVSAVLKRLEQRELVTRCRVEGDARTNALALTDAGTALARELQTKFDALAVAVGKTVPAGDAPVVQEWLKSLLFIHEL